MADFVLKIANFRCHGNKRMSEPNVTRIVESADTKTIHRTKNYDSILWSTEAMANILVKLPIFCYHGNRGPLSKIWLTSLNWPIPKTPYQVQDSGAYLLHKLSYSQFCAENRKFSLPWQQGYVRAKFDGHSWIGRPRKLYHRTNNYDYILYTTEVMANFLVKFPIFRYHGNRGRLSKVWLTPLNWPIPKTP